MEACSHDLLNFYLLRPPPSRTVGWTFIYHYSRKHSTALPMDDSSLCQIDKTKTEKITPPQENPTTKQNKNPKQPGYLARTFQFLCFSLFMDGLRTWPTCLAPEPIKSVQNSRRGSLLSDLHFSGFLLFCVVIITF